MRQINELIWHCTATPEGREVTVRDITAWHRKRGWKTIGYHKVVHLDGSVSEGRPENVVGAHVANRNTGTLGYVYVGGLDKNSRPKDTRTPAQKATMERLTREAIRTYSLKKVSGHKDYAAKACPCFDARAEYMPLVEENRKAWPKDPAKLGKSRIVQGSVTAGAGGVALLGDAVVQLKDADDHFSSGTIFGLVLGGLIVAGALWALYARWDDVGRPLPWRD